MVYCIEKCLLNREETDGMAGCCICEGWFHLKCINKKKKDVEGFWPCDECVSRMRGLLNREKEVMELRRELDELKSIVTKLEERAISECKREVDVVKGKLEQIINKSDDLCGGDWKKWNKTGDGRNMDRDLMPVSPGVTRNRFQALIAEESENKSPITDLLSETEFGKSIVRLENGFLGEEEAAELMDTLLGTCEHDLRRPQRLPREVAYFGKEPYAYGRVKHNPNPVWPKPLLELKEKVEGKLGKTFNAALVNVYRDRNDSVNWHADDEPGLGDTIASVSLGASRILQFKRKEGFSDCYKMYELASGSLMVMEGATQLDWVHRIPKISKMVGVRVNITFRYVKDNTLQHTEGLIVGNKIIKYLDRPCAANGVITVCFPGAGLDEVTAEVGKLLETDKVPMVVQLGCKEIYHGVSETEIGDKVWALVREIKAKGGAHNAIVSGIIYQGTNLQCMKRVRRANQLASWICKQENICFVNPNNILTYPGTDKEGWLLNKRGIQKDFSIGDLVGKRRVLTAFVAVHPSIHPAVLVQTLESVSSW